MIDLTPLEVRQKKGDFRRSVRGYDPELVNDFLDLVADRMEELVRENLMLRERAGTLETDLATFREKERALSEALLAAQKVQEEARTHAEREGELLLREARAAAEKARVEGSRQLAREEDALRQVRARRAQLVDSFRRLLEREMAELEVLEEALELRSRALTGGRRQAARPDRPALEASAGWASAGAVRGAAPGTDQEREEGPRDAPDAEEDGGENAGDDLQEDWLSSLVEEE